MDKSRPRSVGVVAAVVTSAFDVAEDRVGLPAARLAVGQDAAVVTPHDSVDYALGRLVDLPLSAGRSEDGIVGELPRGRSAVAAAATVVPRRLTWQGRVGEGDGPGRSPRSAVGIAAVSREVDGGRLLTFAVGQRRIVADQQGRGGVEPRLAVVQGADADEDPHVGLVRLGHRSFLYSVGFSCRLSGVRVASGEWRRRANDKITRPKADATAAPEFSPAFTN